MNQFIIYSILAVGLGVLIFFFIKLANASAEQSGLDKDRRNSNQKIRDLVKQYG
jgi:hypothetical protein